MEHQIFEITEQAPEVEEAFKEFKHRIALTGMGLTMQGNRVTVRWYDKQKRLVDMHMIIVSVHDGNSDPEEEVDTR